MNNHNEADDYEPDTLSDEENQYEQFQDLIDEGSGDEAYDVFKETPGLVKYLIPAQFGDAYEKIRIHVGEKEAIYFAARFIKGTTEEVGKATLINLLTETKESTALENLLIQMRENYRIFLKEIGKEEGEE